MSESRLKKTQVTVSVSTLLKIVLVIVGLWFLWYVRDIVAMVAAALMLSALIDPFADWFSRHSIPRGLAVIIVYILLLAILSAVIVLLAPVVIDQVLQLLSNFGLAEGLQTTLETTRRAIIDSFASFSQTLTSPIPASLTSLFSTVWGFFASVAAVLIVLVLAFYMVVEEDAARKYFKHLAPAEYQPFLAQLILKMQKKIGAWLRAQIILGLIVGVLVYIGLSIIGVKYALLLAIIAGLFEIIPYVGPVLSIVPSVIIGFAQTPFTGLLVLALYLLIQQFENNVLVPKIMQKITGLNPIVSIVALLIGIKLGGFVGAILAVPVATMIAVVLEELFEEFSSRPSQGSLHESP